MAARNGAMSREDMIRNNNLLRAMLLNTGLRYRKNLGVTIGALGQTTRIKLQNVGITTSLRIYVTCPITIGTAIAVPSQKAPWNLINRIRVTDYDGTDRINVSGFQMYLMDSVRRRQAFGWNNQQAAQAGTGLIVNPSTPTAIGNGVISFWLEIPIAVNDNRWDGLNQDLTGAIYSQTGVGDLYLTIDWNASLYTNNNIESVYAGAATTTVVLNGVAGPSVQVWQNYILPQPVNAQGILPLPQLDLMSVYELNGNLRVSQNIAQNAETLINLPNVRKVIGVYSSFVWGTPLAALNVNDLSLLRYIVNANNILEEWTQVAQIIEQRIVTEGDILAGTYFWNFRDKPIETAIFGNVQLGITPSAVLTGAPYFEIGFESIYTKGAALPGMVQGS